MKDIETIKQELKGWEESLQMRKMVVNQLKDMIKKIIVDHKIKKKQVMEELRESENRIKKGQSALNKFKRDVTEAKKKIEYFKRKKSANKYELKNWTNRNVGKLISKIEEVDNGSI